MSDIRVAIAKVQVMAIAGSTPTEILRYLVADRGFISTVELIRIFKEAFRVGLREVSCIGGWREDGSGELNDEAINKFLSSVVASNA